MIKNEIVHERTKHIDFIFHFIRDVIEYVSIKVHKVITGNNNSHILTNIVPRNVCTLQGLGTKSTWREYASIDANVREQLVGGAIMFNKGLILRIS